jgi:hypothetical protein
MRAEFELIRIAVATKVEVNDALGTPTSVVLTNATGLPVASGITGLGTGIATALAVNVGTSGAPVVNGGALGTPSSGNLSNATGLPAAGVTGTALVAAAIGTTVQAYDADLTTWAGITPGANVGTALAVAIGTAGGVQLNNGSGAGLTSVNAATLGGKTFAAPAAIGSTTPAASSFTTLLAGGLANFQGSASLDNTTESYSFLQFTYNGVKRWTIAGDTNLDFNRYDDSGAYAGTPITINRATGLVTANTGLAVTGALSATGVISSGSTATINTSGTAANLSGSPTLPSGATVDGTEPIGYRTAPIVTITATTRTLAATDSGKSLYLTNGTSTALTIPTNASVAIPIGTVVALVNGSSLCTFTTTGCTVYKAGTATAWASGGTLSIRGLATLIKVDTDTWYISGNALS